MPYRRRLPTMQKPVQSVKPCPHGIPPERGRRKAMRTPSNQKAVWLPCMIRDTIAVAKKPSLEQNVVYVSQNTIQANGINWMSPCN